MLVQGGTTTFLAPALSMGSIGVITMSGAPESHLEHIVSHEFQMPCVMTAYLVGSGLAIRHAGGNNDAHFAAIVEALNGKRVELHCEDRETGRVALLG